MTDIDVLHDLKCCADDDCAECGREATNNCVQRLRKDAASVIKLQMEAIALAEATKEKQAAEIEEFKRLFAANLTMPELIEEVNKILGFGIYDNEESLFLLIGCLQKFLQRIRLTDSVIVFNTYSKCPHIELREAKTASEA